MVLRNDFIIPNAKLISNAELISSIILEVFHSTVMNGTWNRDWIENTHLLEPELWLLSLSTWENLLAVVPHSGTSRIAAVVPVCANIKIL
jgi:hypothetical protein